MGRFAAITCVCGNIDVKTIFGGFNGIGVAGKGFGDSHITGFCNQNAINMPAVRFIVLKDVPLDGKFGIRQVICCHVFPVELNMTRSVFHHAADVL